MATDGAQPHNKPIAIAPAPSGGDASTDSGINAHSTLSVMPYTCQTCAKRKVKCDKVAPICSSCRKGKLNCLYQAPQPRYRKRKLSDDVLERLARYERILRQHGLLDSSDSPSIEKKGVEEPIFLHWNESETLRAGKLDAGQGGSRYIDSSLWRNLGADDMPRISDEEEGGDDEEEGQLGFGIIDDLVPDPLTRAFLGLQDNLLEYHPTSERAMVLWEMHIENVEPICKILHIPSTTKMVERVIQQPKLASKADACLLFAIYNFAVYSMTEEDCAEKLGQSRDIVLQRYHFATRLALVNASFLKTTEMSVLQALILFLLSSRYYYEPQTYWVLTGVAVRIAQRMGIHRDGEKLGLPPFEVQMRRRLFYQLMPLDGTASQMAGTGIPLFPDAWDTQHPLNINDDQIWPGMTEAPTEQQGATEMIFCLARACVGSYSLKASKPANGGGSYHIKGHHSAEQIINEAEKEVEERYIRYCDIVNPLHFLVAGSARSGIAAMRLRIRLSKVKNQTANDAERIELFQLAQKILDTDSAVYALVGLKKYRWHVNRFFLWGTWDSLIYTVASLCDRSDLFSPVELDIAWKKLEQVYQNHEELLDPKRTLHVAFGRLTLKAWDAHPPRGGAEPAFITSLRSMRKTKKKNQVKKQVGSANDTDLATDTTSLIGLSIGSDLDASSSSLSDGIGLGVDNDFNFDTADWMFWDQLIQDYQTQSDQQKDGIGASSQHL